MAAIGVCTLALFVFYGGGEMDHPPTQGGGLERGPQVLAKATEDKDLPKPATQSGGLERGAQVLAKSTEGKEPPKPESGGATSQGRPPSPPQPATGGPAVSRAMDAGSVVLATEEQMVSMERALDEKARELVQQLRADKSSWRGATSDAKEQLQRLRPLPNAGIAGLIECLTDPVEANRQAAASILAYHERGSAAILNALRSAEKTEQTDRVRNQIMCAIDILQTAPREEPVLLDSKQLSNIVSNGIHEILQTPGRTFAHFSLRNFMDGTTSSTWSAGPDDDLPEIVTLGLPGGKCKATIGWSWCVRKSDGKSTIEIPIGGILYVVDGGKLDRSTLAQNSLLIQTSRGWSPLSTREAHSRIRRGLQLGHDKPFDPYRMRCQDAILAAAAMGPEAKALVPDLIKVAELSMEAPLGFVLFGGLSRAFGAIGDRRAIPALKDMQAKAKDGSPIRKVVDKAIANLEKQRQEPISPTSVAMPPTGRSLSAAPTSRSTSRPATASAQAPTKEDAVTYSGRWVCSSGRTSATGTVLIAVFVSDHPRYTFFFGFDFQDLKGKKDFSFRDVKAVRGIPAGMQLVDCTGFSEQAVMVKMLKSAEVILRK